MPSALIVGDSHVHGSAFGSSLEEHLAAAGWTVTRAGVGATSSKSWMSDPVCTPNKSKCINVAELPKSTDLLLISLGTNDGANANRANVDKDKFAGEVADRVAQLAARFGAGRTIWVLPPWLRGNVDWYTQEAMDPIYTAAPQSGLELFDSRPVTEQAVKAGSGDGVHVGAKASEQWAAAVVKQVKEGKGSMSKALVIAGVALVALLAFVALRRK